VRVVLIRQSRERAEAHPDKRAGVYDLAAFGSGQRSGLFPLVIVKEGQADGHHLTEQSQARCRLRLAKLPMDSPERDYIYPVAWLQVAAETGHAESSSARGL
jgi:hypothetical protein